MNEASEYLSRIDSAIDLFQQQTFNAQIGNEIWAALEVSAVKMLNPTWAVQVPDALWNNLRLAWIKLRSLVGGLEYSTLTDDVGQRQVFEDLQVQVDTLPDIEEITIERGERSIPWWVYAAIAAGGLYWFTRK